jgi:hypothetical protein
MSETTIIQQPAELSPVPSLSPAAKFLQTFRERRGVYMQPLRIEFGDDFVFECQVKTLSDKDVTEIGVLMGTRGFSMGAPVASLEALMAFYAAFMVVGVMQFDDDQTRYFETMEAAEEWQQSEGLAAVVNQLRGALALKNPFIQETILGIDSKGRKSN